MKIWTFLLENHGELHGERSLPTDFWSSREGAEEALNAAFKALEDDGDPDMPPPIKVDELRWQDCHAGEFLYWKAYVEEYDMFVHLFQMNGGEG